MWRGTLHASLTSHPLLQSVQQNGSIYIHVYFTKSGFHPDPRQKALYRRLATVHMSRSKLLPFCCWRTLTSVGCAQVLWSRQKPCALDSGVMKQALAPLMSLAPGHPGACQREQDLGTVQAGVLARALRG